MSAVGRDFWSTFMLLSRIPSPPVESPVYRRAGFYFPLLGFFPGLILLGFGAAAGTLGLPAYFAAGIGLFVQYAAFNIFHYDGLLDSADALLYRTSAERRLEILKDNKIGSFAHFTGILYLLMKVALLSELIEAQNVSGLLLLMAVPIWGRMAGAWLPVLARPVRSTGLGALLCFGPENRYSKPALALGVLLSAAVPTGAMWAASTAGLHAPPNDMMVIGAGALFVPLAVGFFCARQYQHKVGGLTGDAYGLAIELGELAALLVLYLMVA